MKKLSVLIVDDSALMRNLISKIIEKDPKLCVAGTALNGVVGLKKIQELKPDMITLDLEMPEMDGITLLINLKKLKLQYPVIILSSLAKKGASITMQALNLGACDFVLKPTGSISLDIEKIAEELREKIHIHYNYYQRKTGKSNLSLQESERPLLDPKGTYRKNKNSWPHYERTNIKQRKPMVLCIGASTGGPMALKFLLSKLPLNFPLPVLIVQHMPSDFMSCFTQNLDIYCPLQVFEAENQQKIIPGKVFVAPGNSHMTVASDHGSFRIELSHNPSFNGHRPSVDVLFESIAKVYLGAAIAILMTGMGEDGAYAIGTLFSKGAFTIAQDEFSSVVYGMPKIAVDHGYIWDVLPLGTIPKKINEIVNMYCQ